jgi:hypothetical protein
MQHLPALLGITGLTVIGFGAIAKIAFVTAQFGILEPTQAGRNEVRAVGCPLHDVALLPLGQSPAGLRSTPYLTATESTQRKPMKYVSIVALLVAGIIHLLPVPGVMGVGTLARLYGIEVSDPNTAILMQHRALLFGVLGVLMLSAIALPWLRVTVLSVGLFSAASFIVVAMAVGGYNPAIGRVVFADVVASVLLGAGLVAELWLMGRKTT